MNLLKNKKHTETKKETTPLKMKRGQKKLFALYAVMVLTFCIGATCVYAAGDPLAMFLLLFFFLVTGGFWYLKSSIPDQLNVASYEDVDTIKLHFQSMVKDEVVYASVSAENTKIPEEKIKIQCSFLGFVPLKTVEIQQKELPQVLPIAAAPSAKVASDAPQNGWTECH